MLVNFDDNDVVKEYVSKQEVLVRVEYVVRKLNFRSLYNHYHLPWLSDGEHQLSCHFHGADRHPSARFYPSPPRFWCYACGEGGDVVWWVKKQEGLKDMVKALDFIAREFGIGFDSKDLSSRIKLLAEVKDDPKRQMMVESASNKVNDVLYEARRVLPKRQARWDALEKLIFTRYRSLQEATHLEYMAATSLYRDWTQWAVTLVQRVAREAS
jgi:hypothetical protein